MGTRSLTLQRLGLHCPMNRASITIMNARHLRLTTCQSQRKIAPARGQPPGRLVRPGEQAISGSPIGGSRWTVKLVTA